MLVADKENFSGEEAALGVELGAVGGPRDKNRRSGGDCGKADGDEARSHFDEPKTTGDLGSNERGGEGECVAKFLGYLNDFIPSNRHP